LAAGTTSTVAISYQVSPVVQLVTPYVETSGVADEVVIRGIGLTSFAVQGVRFGDVAATAFTIPSGSTSEIRATHPALPAGTYPVRLITTNHQGDIPTTASLIVADPTAYAAATLAYPATPSAVRTLIYDAERRALLVLTDAGGGSLVRYPYNGTSWDAATTVAAGLNDAALSAKGTTLYGVSPTSFVPVDPVTLASGTAVAAPSLATGAFLNHIVVGNDDVGLVTTGIGSSTATALYLYSSVNNNLIATSSGLNNATPVMSANGALAYMVQGDPSLTSDVPLLRYITAGNAFGNSGITLRQNTVAPALSRTANRLIVNGVRVYDGSEAFLGTLPTTIATVVMKADGTRAYAYDPTAGGILVYDISVDRDEAAYTALGAPVPLAGNPGNNPKMILSPDGGTLFLAGSTQVVVQPTPAL
jgi:hypothetical protein